MSAANNTSSNANAGVPSRKSFAQVAAAAATPPKPVIPKVKTSAPPAVESKLQSPTSVPAVPQASPDHEQDATQNVPGPFDGAADETVQLASAIKTVSLNETGLHSPGIRDHLDRKDMSDTRSVASRTTLTLDEKDSIRPDDSASMQAAADRDTVSPPESHVADSKADSNSDARAFRDQLYEIDRTETKRILAQRPQIPVDGTPAQHNGAIVYAASPAPAVQQPDLLGKPPPSLGPPAGLVVPPDEKLLEALASPKDRLFVLKIEQDLIDFIKSKETQLQLPQTHAFYRMLSHKLAEYYFLGHVFDESSSSVRIHRLPYSRLPPPLIETEIKTDGPTPPPAAAARKIMRRGMGNLTDPDGESDGIPFSHGTLDRTSGSLSDDEQDSKKDKAAMSREEREARYAETRARIFQDFNQKSSETSDAGGSKDEKGISRSSSNSGNKKKTKKKPKDDTFEARSAYSRFGGQHFVNNGFPQAQPDGSYYNGFPGNAQYPGMVPAFPAGAQPFQMGASPGPQQDFGGMNSWAAQQYGQQYGMVQGMNGYGQLSPQQYDPAHGGQHFGSPSMAAQATPRPHQSNLAGFYPGYQQQPQQPDNSAWMQQGYPNSFVQANSFGNPPHMGGQGAYMTPYGFSHPDYNAQHYGGYGGQAFNPQSQSFIPRGPMTANPQFPMAPGWMPMAPAMQQQQSNTSFGSNNYGSPHFRNPSPGLNNNSARTHNLPSSPNQRHMTSDSPNARNVSTGSTSSISKFASTSSLPAKPPQPASTLAFQVPRHSDSHNPLPSHPFAATNGRS